MNQKIKKNIVPISFFSLATVLILWQTLLPGYILSLDMIFTPKIKVIFGEGFFYNTLVYKYVFSFFNYLLSGWLIQKIVFAALFFCLGFLIYYYLPLPKKSAGAFWAGLFFMANPFVYERFLAGHWPLLLGLAFFAPLFFWTFNFAKNPQLKPAFWQIFWLILISFFSIHALVMAAVLIAVYDLLILIRNLIIKNHSWLKKYFGYRFLGVIIFLVISSYWLLPYFLDFQNSVITNFDQKNLEVFKSVNDPRLGIFLNVLSLHGFWGENQEWAKYFLWPKDNFIFWLFIFGLLMVIIAGGIVISIKDKMNQEKSFYLLAGSLGLIFALGVNQTIFQGLNEWLFTHLWFWRGFRDSQKWSGLLLLSYAYFGGVSVNYWFNRLRQIKLNHSKTFLLVCFGIIFFYTYPIWGGFSRQLKPAWYPLSWFSANDFFNQDKSEFEILILPWHQYLSFDFNQKLIIQNPVKEFFDHEVISGENMEIGGIYSQASAPKVQKIENILLKTNDLKTDEVVARLREEGIKYILHFNEFKTVDESIVFNFNASRLLKKALDLPELTIYEIL
ncbi:MAG TPA: hypothetical protein VJG65_01240 [Patescibacteria group bacterium]|nr:hypothetical protein [Patescibacteria group bacterium]